MPGLEFVRDAMPTHTSYSEPQYRYYLDESIRNENLIKKNQEELVNLKSFMVDHLYDRKEHYDKSNDPNSTLMKALTPTIILPIAYYFYRGLVCSNLPSYRAEQCSDLIDVVRALGTNTELGKKFISNKLRNLFTILEQGNSISLMRILIAVYGTALKTGIEKIDEIDKYKQKHGFNVNFDFDIKQYLNSYKQRVAEILKDNQALVPVLDKVVNSYNLPKI